LEAQTQGLGFTGSRPSILLINKTDETRNFALSQAQLDAAKAFPWHLIQASAKSGDNVVQGFTKLAELMIETRKATG
jgi:hypothetical protein